MTKPTADFAYENQRWSMMWYNFFSPFIDDDAQI